jgi:hypothetical protein
VELLQVRWVVFLLLRDIEWILLWNASPQAPTPFMLILLLNHDAPDSIALGTACCRVDVHEAQQQQQPNRQAVCGMPLDG